MDEWIVGVDMDEWIVGIGMDEWIVGVGMDEWIVGVSGLYGTAGSDNSESNSFIPTVYTRTSSSGFFPCIVSVDEVDVSLVSSEDATEKMDDFTSFMIRRSFSVMFSRSMFNSA